MKFRTYKYIFLITSFVAFTGCKPQQATKPLIKKNIETNNSITYESIKDSVLCASGNNQKGRYIHYELPFFKIETEFEATQPYTFFSKDSLKRELKAAMAIIKNECATDDISGGDLHYNIYCNQKNIVSMTLLHENFNGRLYPLHYFSYAVHSRTLNTTIQDSYGVKMIAERKKDSFLLMLNNELHKIITKTIAENDFDNFEREITQSDKAYVKERLSQKEYSLDDIPKSVIVINHRDYKNDGILFCEINAPSFLEERYLSGTMTIFFTFKQLKPFLSEDFKKHIEL